MKQVILNENKLNGLTVYETAPIGSLIAFLGTSAPAGWLLCNQDYELKQSDYPDLYNMVKDFTACQSETSGYFKIPNLSGLVLQGESGNLGEILSAGLPNITGTIGGQANYDNSLIIDGAFEKGEHYVNVGGGTHVQVFRGLLDASKSNEIYGNSDTVQPPAFTVNYILKATNYVSLPTNAIDDTKATTGNCWSASKVNEKLSYSTTETVIGTYLDKPLYRKTISGTYSRGTTILTDVKIVVKVSGMFQVNTSTWYPIGYIDSETNGFITLESNNLKFYTNKTGKMELTIEYTKTTD